MYPLLSSLALPYQQFCYFLHNQPLCFLGDPDFYFSWRKIALQCCVVFCCSVQFSSVTRSCTALCDPMDHSTPGLPVHHQLLELIQTNSIELVMPSNHLILCRPFSSCLQSFPASGSFKMSPFFTSDGQSVGVSASTSVLPMNIQD